MTELSQGLPSRRRLIAVLAMSMGSLMLMIDASITAVALPTIARQLGVEGSSTVLVVTVYQLVLAMSLLPFAALGQRFGHRRLYQGGLIMHTVAAALCLLAETLPTLIVARSLQALGSAAAMSVGVGLVRSIYPPQWLGRGLAVNTVANASGTALAPVIGGLVLSMASWQWVFAAATPLAVLSLMLSRALPTPEPDKQRFDLAGAILCAATFGLIIAGLEGAIHTQYIAISLAVVVVGAILGRFFTQHQLRQVQPVLPVDLLARPVIALAIMATFGAILASTALMLIMPFRLEHEYGLSPGQIGTVLAAYAVASVMISPLSGALSDRIPVAILSTCGMVVASVGLLLVALLPEAPTHYDIAWRLWVCGAGFGLFFAPNARLVVGAAPLARAASAGSLYTTTRMLGLAVGATFVAALLALGLNEGAVPLLVAMCFTIVAGLISATGLKGRGAHLKEAPRDI